MLPTDRKQAKIENSKYYYNGKNCSNGHDSKRFTHNGCCYQCVMESNKRWFDKNKTDIEWRKKKIYNITRNRANRKNIPFEIEYSDIEWPTHCPVFGVELEYTSLDKAKFNSASIDKIFPELGYVKGNVKIISHRANWLKQDSTIEQLEKIIQYMKGNKN